jgi:hypothetical protein
MANDPLFDEINIIAQKEIYPEVVADLYFRDTPFLAHLRAKCLVPFRGGSFMQNVFSYAPMATGSYARGQNWDIDKRKTLGATIFDPKYYVAVVPEYEEDLEVLNKGELSVFSLINLDLRNAINSISAATAIAINNHGQASGSGITGNHPNDINGWPEAYNDGVNPGYEGSVFTTYGGATRNGVVGSALNSVPYWCGTAAGGVGPITYPIMNKTYWTCCRGRQQPNLGVGNKAVMSYIEDRIQPAQRFGQEQDPYWGVSGLKMKNAILLVDDYFPSLEFGVNDTDLGNYLTSTITGPSAASTPANMPASSVTLTVGEVFCWFNTDKWLFRISDSRKYGYGFGGFVPAQDNSRVVGVIRAAVNLECTDPWSGRQLFGIGG